MTNLIYLIFVLTISFISFVFIMMMLKIPYWYSYVKIYKTLENRKYYINGNYVYSYTFPEKDDNFCWWIIDGHFKLKSGVYLLNRKSTYIDPFSLYWFFKYKNWFKKNIDINKIEKQK